MDSKLKLCRCGSGHFQFPVRDARGIFIDYVCQRCKDDKLSAFNPEIMINPNYDLGDRVAAGAQHA